MVSDKFIRLASSRSEVFPALLDMMYHTKKDEYSEFLCVINNILDHLFIEENDEVCHYVIHINNCPSWARELLVRFLIHKIALSSNKTRITELSKKARDFVVLPYGVSGKSKKALFLTEENKFYKKIKRIFSPMNIQNNDAKSLMIVKDTDIITRNEDRNPWLPSLYTKSIENINDHNTIVSTNYTTYVIENTIKEIRKKGNNVPKIENIYIFHSSNRSQITNSYNINQLKRLNRYGVGIKRCIVFSISEKQLKLYQNIDGIKNRLASSLLNKEVKMYNDFPNFITFTQEEISYLFHRKRNIKVKMIDPDERDIFSVQVDSFLDQIPHIYKYKNLLSLSFTKELQNVFIETIKKENINIDETQISDFFNYYRILWDSELKDELLNFVGNENNLAIIVPYDTPQHMKKLVKYEFLTGNTNLSISFYSMEQLRYGIQEKNIIVFQYKYTDRFYSTYPNSFDPLPIKDGQRVLVIINRLTHNNLFAWNYHNYEKSYNGFLYSEYRKTKLGWNYSNNQRPQFFDIESIMSEAESDNKRGQVEKCTVVYGDDRKREYLACDKLLYKRNNMFYISTLRELSGRENLRGQILDELIEQIKKSLLDKATHNTKAEEIIRRNPQYGLSEEEIKSSVELWKYLLLKKIMESSPEKVYDDIFPYEKTISLEGFKRWYDLENDMILPRSHKHQLALLRYLGFEKGSPYHIVILRKKLLGINTSRQLNGQIEALLRDALTNEDLKSMSKEKFDSFMDKHLDILAMLNINSIEEILTLIELLEINPRTIKNIIYYDPA